MRMGWVVDLDELGVGVVVEIVLFERQISYIHSFIHSNLKKHGISFLFPLLVPVLVPSLCCLVIRGNLIFLPWSSLHDRSFC